MRAEAIRRRLRAESSDSDSEGEPRVDEDGGAASQPENVYVVPSTGARVTIYNAKGLLFHYCTKLPCDKYARLHHQYSPTVYPPISGPVIRGGSF
jgi:hypothetical protein